MNMGSYRLSFEGSREALARFDQPAASDPGQRTTEFRAVEGGGETMSGSTLLVEAYAALWLIVLGFVLVSWRRQSRIDARVEELERAVVRGQAK